MLDPAAADRLQYAELLAHDRTSSSRTSTHTEQAANTEICSRSLHLQLKLMPQFMSSRSLASSWSAF
jgi:hypothetical protein